MPGPPQPPYSDDEDDYEDEDEEVTASAGTSNRLVLRSGTYCEPTEGCLKYNCCFYRSSIGHFYAPQA